MPDALMDPSSKSHPKTAFTAVPHSVPNPMLNNFAVLN